MFSCTNKSRFFEEKKCFADNAAINEKEGISAILFFAILKCSFATLVAHPARVWLNDAGAKRNPIETISDAGPRMRKDAALNIFRGIGATCIQSVTKRMMQQYCGEDTLCARFAGTVCAGFAGVIATPIEVIFVRKNLIGDPDGPWRDYWKKYGRGKYNRYTYGFYTARELGFCIGAFDAVNMQWPQYLFTLAIVSVWTGAMHNLVTRTVTKDIARNEHLIPDWEKEGILKGLYGIADGKYKEGPFKALYSNPATVTQRTKNLLSATCSWNMFAFRSFYLAVFGGLVCFAENGLRHIQAEVNNHSYKKSYP
jgi:hypothetical protein